MNNSNNKKKELERKYLEVIKKIIELIKLINKYNVSYTGPLSATIKFNALKKDHDLKTLVKTVIRLGNVANTVAKFNYTIENQQKYLQHKYLQQEYLTRIINIHIIITRILRDLKELLTQNINTQLLQEINEYKDKATNALYNINTVRDAFSHTMDAESISQKLTEDTIEKTHADAVNEITENEEIVSKSLILFNQNHLHTGSNTESQEICTVIENFIERIKNTKDKAQKTAAATPLIVSPEAEAEAGAGTGAGPAASSTGKTAALGETAPPVRTAPPVGTAAIVETASPLVAYVPDTDDKVSPAPPPPPSAASAPGPHPVAKPPVAAT